jgi:hypothetical protein
MPKSKTRRKYETNTEVHMRYLGSKRWLCSPKRKGNTTSDPSKVTCLPCGRAAHRAVQELEAVQAQREAAGRQEAALAGGRPPHWTEARMRDVTP